MNHLQLRTILRFILVLIVCAAVSVSGFRVSLSNSRLSFPITSPNRFRPLFRGVSFEHSSISSKQLAQSFNHAKSLKFKVADNEDDVDEEDVEEIEFDSPVNGNLGLLKKFSGGVIPLATTLGFAVTPSPSLAFRIAGATIGGIAGFIARKVLINKIKSIEDAEEVDEDVDSYGPSDNVLDALRTIISSSRSISTLTTKKIEAIAKQCKVPANELAMLFTYLFAEVVFQSTKSLAGSSDSSDLTELSSVIDFASSAGLTGAEIGDGFALAANRIGLQLEKNPNGSGFYSDEYPVEVLEQAAQVFFLADKMLDAVSGFEGFYGKRLDVILGYFTAESYQKTITASCNQLYRRCIESVVSDPTSFSIDEVDELREFLSARSPMVSSFRPANMQNMVMETLQASLDRSLQPAQAGQDSEHSASMHVAVENYDNLAKAQSILGWNGLEFDATVEIRTLPIFEKAAKQIIDDVLAKPDHAEKYVGVLEERLAALKVPRIKAIGIITRLMSDKNMEYMNRIDKVYTAAKGLVDPAFKIMVGYANGHAAFCSLAESIMEGAAIPVPGLPFTDMVRVSLFEFQLKSKRDSDKAVSEDMFDLDEVKRGLVRKSLALPKITSWVSTCLSQSNFDEGAKAAYQKLLDEFNISDMEWSNTAMDFYYQEVQRIAQSRAVPSAADLDRLTKVRAFLGCADSPSVSKVNLELFGDKYVKALTECMTPTGVIADDYVDGLTRLRDRLGLSPVDAQQLLGVASRSRMGPVIKGLLDQFKSDTDPKARAEKESSRFAKKRGDPISSMENVLGYVEDDLLEDGAQKSGGGPNVFMREALNMIDFFEENFLTTQGVDLSGSIASYPVTAVGIVPEADLIDLFKHYLITRLSEKDPELSSRYAGKEAAFALALGLPTDSQVKVKESLAYTATKNMVKNILKFRDSVTPQDLQQMAALSQKDKLAIDKDVAERILNEAFKGAVIEHAATIFRVKDGPPITAEIAQRFRTQVQSLGLEMKKDTGFNDKLITYLFALEVQSIIENDAVDELKDVQDAYDVPEEKAELIVEACSKRYINQLLNLALRAAKKYDEKDCMRWAKSIAKYAVFVEGTVDADANMYSESDKARLINFFENSEDPELAEQSPLGGETRAEMVQRLQAIINLTEDYVAPLQGIEGLLGNVQNLNELMTADPKANKKRWAWG